jgi:hypothetical protein
MCKRTPWQQKPKVHHRTHNSPQPVPILSQLKPLHPPANLLDIHSDLVLPSTTSSSKWSLSFRLSHQNQFSLLSHACLMPRSTHPPALICLIISGEEEITNCANPSLPAATTRLMYCRFVGWRKRTVRDVDVCVINRTGYRTPVARERFNDPLGEGRDPGSELWALSKMELHSKNRVLSMDVRS